MKRWPADAVAVTVLLGLMSCLVVAAAMAGALLLACGAQVVALACAWILGKLTEMDAQIRLLERNDRAIDRGERTRR